MNVKRIWRQEVRKRKANKFRKERMIRNWPIHAQRAVEVFRAFALEAEKDGVRLMVREPEWSPHPDSMGEFILGASSVHIRFASEYTGEGLLTRTADGENTRLDLERGSELIIHHSPADGSIQVFFEYPASNLEEEQRKEPLLYAFTYNTDLLTYDWLASLLPRFLSFNRVESRLEHPSFLDTWRMRLWRFTDVRNRRGYLNTFQHLLTPWELLLLGAFAALPGLAAIQWLWGKL
ncbi:hypothetical protein PS858_04140 [Pseudomonas fluorescens]|uniref:hypothetical protein n=1 Tax=Pseudomonas fluorescens TaxID=294 RepID=UPI001241C830|nr:hypothetical protein [Pseudomonas fluorescens]VVP27484.1 hypothetical protein PS858_04140 [Pseudomonas fluorescens]